MIKDDSLTITQVLYALKGKSELEVDAYLQKNHSHDADFIEAIKTIINLDKTHSTIPFSEIISASATKVMTDSDPYRYVGNVFSEWVATDVIKVTAKSILLKGEPSNHSYKQDVAIKILLPLFDYAGGTQTLQKQAHYMSNNKHSNIVDVFVAGECQKEKTSYLVMEYLPGRNILDHSVIQKFNVKQILKLITGVSNALKYMHQIPIVHADIKPKNILLNELDEPKIIDFDLAFTSNSNFELGYEYKDIKGYSNFYASPEQLSGKKLISTKSDIYSLGKVLLALLLKKELEEGDELTLDGLISTYGKSSRYVELLSIVEKSTHENIDCRYDTVAELIADIELYLKGTNIVNAYISKASYFYKNKRRFFRYRVPLAFASVVISVISIGLYGYISKGNEVNKTYKMFVRQADPTYSDAHNDFEKQADTALIGANYLSLGDWYEGLIVFGDAYQGQGNYVKATSFYEKAMYLYPSKDNLSHIQVVNRLILNYHQIGEGEKIKNLLTYYKKDLIKEDQKNPLLIEMFYNIFEIQMKYFKQPGTLLAISTKEYLNLLAKLDIEKIEDVKKRNDMKVLKYLYQSIEGFYTLDGDVVSSVSYISEEQYSLVVYPQLTRSRDLIYKGLDLIHNSKRQNINEGRLYIWGAYMNSELGDIELAEQMANKGLDLIINRYGTKHPATEGAYRKIAGMFRYHKQKKSLDSIEKAWLISREKSRKFKFSYHFNSELYLDFLSNNGLFKKMNEVFDQYNEYKKEPNRIEQIDYSSISGIYYLYFSLSDFLTEKQVDNVYRLASNFYSELPSKIRDKDNYNTVDYESKIFSIYQRKRNGASSETLIELIKKESKSLKKSNMYNFYRNYGVALAMMCLNVEGCEPEKYIAIFEHTLKWNQHDKKVSLERLHYNIYMGYIFSKTGNVAKSTYYLESITNLLDRLEYDSYFHGLYYFSKALNTPSDNPTQKRSHLNQALSIMEFNMGADSGIVAMIKKELNKMQS